MVGYGGIGGQLHVCKFSTRHSGDQAKRNAGEEATSRIQSQNMVMFGLEGVRTRAKTDKTCLLFLSAI